MPHSDASALSLREQIEDEIRKHGPMPFSRYMQICLYDHVRGYYSRNVEQFGKAGDFYTSSDLHAVFGRLLARQFDEIWQALDRPTRIEIVELGPGRGLFARDVLDWTKKKFPDFFAALTYTLQEGSTALRAKLHENLREHILTGQAHVSEEKPTPADSLGERDNRQNNPLPEERPKIAQRFSAGNNPTTDVVPEGRLPTLLRTLGAETPLIVFANEFFDALPVEILSRQGKLHIATENNRLHEIWLPALPEELKFLDRYGVHPEANNNDNNNERIEVPLRAQTWIQQIASSITRGLLLIIDYGYTRAEQLAGRHRGTLIAYRHHSASADPYEAPGEQDLTAHVNFTALTSACDAASMRVEELLTQSQFLLGIGQTNQFADVFEDCRVSQERAKVTLQLKHLITPEGMGENFRVMIASRQIGGQKLAALSGLNFGRRSQ